MSLEPNLSLRERFADLSIESGILCVNFDAMHARMEGLLGRPVFTHEMADPDVWLSMKVALVMPEYQEIVREDPVSMLERMVGKEKVIRVGV